MKQPTKQFALCIDNVGNEASLILGKVYRIIPDPRAAKDDLVRIIDESGEDYKPVRFCRLSGGCEEKDPRNRTGQLTAVGADR